MERSCYCGIVSRWAGRRGSEVKELNMAFPFSKEDVKSTVVREKEVGTG